VSQQPGPVNDVLSRLEGSQWRQLLTHGHTLSPVAGDVIITEGQVEEAFYVVLSGELEATVELNGTARRLGRLQAGSLFGEVAFFGDVPRTASVRATCPSTVLRVDRADFERLVATDSELALQLLFELGRTMAIHFRDNSEGVTRATR